MITITTKGSDFKVDLGTGDILYYPIDDITQRAISTTVELYLQGDLVHSFKSSDFASPSGTAEQIADAISALSNISSQDFLLEVSKGNREKHSIVIIDGRNADVGTSSLVDVGMKNEDFNWLTAASSLEAISTSTSDTAAGTGCRKITVEGLDANFDPITADIVMNGTTVTASTVPTFIRVNKVTCIENGAYASTGSGSNDGDITIRVSGAGAIQSFISKPTDLMGAGASQDVKYTIPNNHIAIVTGVGFNVNSIKQAKLLFLSRQGADVIAAPFTPKVIASIIDGGSGRHSIPKEELNTLIIGKTDIWAASIATANNTEVAARIVILLIDQS